MVYYWYRRRESKRKRTNMMEREHVYTYIFKYTIPAWVFVVVLVVKLFRLLAPSQ